MKTKWVLLVSISLFLSSLIAFHFKWEEPVVFPCLVPSSLACWEYRTLAQQLRKQIPPETGTLLHRHALAMHTGAQGKARIGQNLAKFGRR